MGDSFEVNLSEMQQHAAKVAQIANQVNTAMRIATAAVNGGSYGVIGQFFAMALIAACGDVRDAIMKAVKSFTDVQAGLKAVEKAYNEVDKTHAELMQLLKGDEGK
jgi:Excreted virulence factor EspC, type VII ESX diderm